MGRRRPGGVVEPLGEPEPPTEPEEFRGKLGSVVTEVVERSGLLRAPSLSPADLLLASPVAEARSDYMVACEAGGLAPGTLRTYDLVRRQCIEAFGADLRMLDLRPRQVQDLQIAWRRRGLTDWTIAGRTTVLKQWLYWGLDQKRFALQFDPAGIKASKGKRKPRARSPEEIDRLLAAWDPDTYEGSRNRVMVLLAVDTGARAGEIVGMDVQDVSPNRRVIRVLGKGMRSRALQVSPPMAATLDRWVKYRAPALAEVGITDDGVLFPASRGRQQEPRQLKVSERRWSVLDRDRRMRSNVFTNACRDASHRAGIDPPILPHAFRRTWATSLVRSGKDIKTIQTAGGWENLTTMAYHLAEASEDDLAALSEASLLHKLRIGDGQRVRRRGRPRQAK